MKRFWVLGLILPAAIAWAGAVPAVKEGTGKESDYSRKFEKTIEAAPGAVFSLDNSFGDVDVKTWDQSKIGITADIRVDARTDKQAAEFGEKIQIEVIPSAERISVKTVYPARTRSSSRISFSVDYTVLLPAGQAADLSNAFGDITVNGVNGALTVKGKHGGVDVSRCSNLALLKNEFGSIDFEEVGGKAVEVENQNGDITGSGIHSASLKVSNRFGSVELSKADGDLAVRNANGDVTITGAAKSALVDDQFGSIRVTDIGGLVKIKSGNGSVEAENIGGGEIENSFGSVSAVNASTGIKIANANGDISVKSIKGNANLSATFGRIEALGVEGDVTATAQNSSVEISGAGGKVTVEDTFGPVEVRGSRSDVSIRNQNGSIECTPSKAGKAINLESTFGSIELTLPADVSAALRAETTFGSIECDFPLKIGGSDNQTAVEGTLGGGESRIDVRNQNGDVRIIRENPGK